MGKTTNGIVHPAEDGTTLQSEYYADPDTGISAHKQFVGIEDARIGYYGKVQVINGGLAVSNIDAASVAFDSMLTYDRGSNYINGLTSSALVMGSAGKLKGIEITAFTGTPTIKLWANTAASGTVLVDTFTVTATGYRPYPARRTGSGIYATVAGTGTLTYTVDFDPTTY